MDALLLTHLDHLERTLNTLTRSISSYTPSTPAASSLLSANASLSTSITDLATHQRNHTRIQSLQRTSTALEIQLTSHLQALVKLRKEIRAAPLHAPPELAKAPGVATPGAGAATAPSRLVPAKELIDYALVGARFLPPGSFKPPSVMRGEAGTETAPGATMVGEGEAQTQTQQTTAAASPVPGTAVASPEPITPAVSQALVAEDVDMANQGNEEKDGIYTLSEQEKSWLDPSLGIPFVPWINEMQIQSSALNNYQGRAADVLQRMKAEDEAAAREAAALARKQAGQDTGSEDTAMGGAGFQTRPGAGAQADDGKAVFAGWDDED